MHAHLAHIAPKGGTAMYKKYGRVDMTNKRGVAWRIWWESVGKNDLSHPFNARSIFLPIRSINLAEFVGIMLGDGGVTPFQITITLHSVDDLLYADYVTNLIKKLFGVTPKRYKKKSKQAINIVVSRKKLSEFCQKLGLPIGNKIGGGAHIPRWVSMNQKYIIGCMRGLFDTDGSFFIHSYVSKGRKYSYLKISFSNASPPLIDDVFSSLQKLKICARVSKNCREVLIESKKDVHKFIKIIGTHNPKHQNKIRRVAPNGKAADC